MTDSDRAAALRALETQLLAMPPVAALGLRVGADEGDDRLRLHAPLAANINDKGCAFGGSLTSLMTLAGWGLIVRRLAAAGLEADVYVGASEIRYRAPLYADLEALATPAADQAWDAFLHAFRTTGKARFAVLARVPLPEGGVAAEGVSRYVAVRKG